jgi:penicillin amidase
VPQNVVLADDFGDIGYMMLAPIPKRRDRTPNLGNRVLDGTTSAYDWDGLIPSSELPRGINPTKGFFSTANNRAMPENSIDDVGANAPSTGRAQRIDEILAEMIRKD